MRRVLDLGGPVAILETGPNFFVGLTLMLPAEDTEKGHRLAQSIIIQDIQRLHWLATFLQTGLEKAALEQAETTSKTREEANLASTEALKDLIPPEDQP